jgi:very-short-patch-repair endonuclease
MGIETDALILRIASRTDGAITHRQLTEAGIATSSIQRRRGGLLTPFANGVYLVGAPTSRATLMAALAATPGGVASHETAAQLHGLLVAGGGGLVHISREGGRRRALPGVRIHRTVELGPDDRCHLDGVVATTLERTLCDLARRLHFPRLRPLTEQQIVDRRTTPTKLHGQIRSFVRRGRPGSTKLRLLLVAIGDGEPILDSVLEQRMRSILRQTGIGDVESQFRPPWHDGIRGIVDFGLPELQLIVEADGRRWHAVTQAQEEDRRRDRRAARHGWTVLRFSGHEITHRKASLAAELRGLFAARRAELAA